MITNRDLQVVDFLDKYRIASTTTLEHFFFPSRRVAQRRLKVLSDMNYIRRSKENFYSDYYYYLKKPKQLRHSLLITNFYREFSKYVEIQHFECQKKIDQIIPDGLIGYTKNHIKKIAILEVELSNNGFDYQKYRNFPHKKHFNMIPDIFVVTKHQIKNDSKINFIQIRDIEHDLDKFFEYRQKNVI